MVAATVVPHRSDGGDILCVLLCAFICPDAAPYFSLGQGCAMGCVLWYGKGVAVHGSAHTWQSRSRTVEIGIEACPLTPAHTNLEWPSKSKYSQYSFSDAGCRRTLSARVKIVRVAIFTGSGAPAIYDSKNGDTLSSIAFACYSRPVFMRATTQIYT